MNDIPIQADISPSLHPDVLGSHAEALEERPGSLATGKAALSAAYRYIGAINDAQRAMHAEASARSPSKRRQLPDGQSQFLGDLRMTGAGGLRQFTGEEEALAHAAGVAFEGIARQIDKARGELLGTAETLEKTIALALTDPAGDTPAVLAMQTEIRAHVKALPEKDRFAFVTKAINAGDLPSVAAVLRGQPFLSGLTEDTAGQLRIAAGRTFAPRATKELAAVSRIVSAVEQAGAAVMDRFTNVEKAKDTPAAKKKRALAKLSGVK